MSINPPCPPFSKGGTLIPEPLKHSLDNAEFTRMQEIRQQKNSVIWSKGREIVQIEPWGKDSLRVRATVAPEIRDGLPGALLEPEPILMQLKNPLLSQNVVEKKLPDRAHSPYISFPRERERHQSA